MSRNELEIPSGVGDGVMLDVLQGFVHELRAAGLPVSMTENLDAMRGVEQIPLTEREAFREVLAATLVKSFRHRRGVRHRLRRLLLAVHRRGRRRRRGRTARPATRTRPAASPASRAAVAPARA